MRYSSKARAKVSDRYFFLSPDTRTIHCIMFQCCAYTPLLFSFSYCRRSYVISRRRKCERKNAPTSKRFRCFPRNGEPRWPIHRMHEMAGNISGDLTNHRSRNRRLCVDRIVQTRTAYAYRDRVFSNVFRDLFTPGKKADSIRANLRERQVIIWP